MATKTPIKPPTIAITDDDPDDRVLLAAAFAEALPGCEILLFDGGSALIDHLRAALAEPAAKPLPAMLLLDLNMPGIDGHQTLRLIRAEPGLMHLPVVILSTSRSASDCLASYRQGANAFISKPSGYRALVETARDLLRFWTEVARLPAA